MIRPRWLARVLAALRGYFWMPCPICGEYFAGFEWGAESLMVTWSHSSCVCSKLECAEETTKRNAAFQRMYPPTRTNGRTLTRDELETWRLSGAFNGDDTVVLFRIWINGLRNKEDVPVAEFAGNVNLCALRSFYPESHFYAEPVFRT